MSLRNDFDMDMKTNTDKVKGKTINLLKDGMLLPPSPDKCQQCAIKHLPEHAHDANSLFYQYWFKKHYDRWPTWKDAVKHCPPEIKKFGKRNLKQRVVPI